MATLQQVIAQVDKVARQAAGGVVKHLPSPEGCGCGRRKRKMLKAIGAGRSAVEIVKEQLADIRGK